MTRSVYLCTTPYWTDWARWTVVLRPDQLHSEPACRVPLISEDGEFLVLLLQIGPISAESTTQGRRELGAQIPGHERGRQKSRTHRNCRTCLGLSQGQGRMARGRRLGLGVRINDTAAGRASFHFLAEHYLRPISARMLCAR